MANLNSITTKHATRTLYKLNFFKDVPNQIDFWESQRYYGLLDSKGIPICLNDDYLKSISDSITSNNNRKEAVLNIVADSFRELNNEFKKADMQLSIPKSIFNPLKIKKSTVSINKTYNSYLTKLISSWYQIFKNEIDGKINNFDDFLKLFITKTFANKKIIFSKSCYVTSNISSVLNTGLAIEIANSSYEDDLKKITNFINDENFQFFYNTAAKYSFVIDKNAPWRLVYNLSTEYALEKMNNYKINTLQEMFDNFYVYPHLTDYKEIKTLITNFYSITCINKPSFQKSSYCKNINGLKFDTVIKNTNFEKSDLFWIELYYFIRCKEEQIAMNQSQFDSDLRTINMIYNKFGEIPTLEWIYNKTKKFVDGGTNPDYNQYAAVYKANKNNITAYTFNF